MYTTTIIINHKNCWILTTFFLGFVKKQQLGKLQPIPNSLVFSFFGFSKGSQKTKHYLNQLHKKKDLTSVSRCGIMSAY